MTAAIVLRSPATTRSSCLREVRSLPSERLEVLALATTQRYPDGRPLRDTLAALAADGVLGRDSMGLRQVVDRRGVVCLQLS